MALSLELIHKPLNEFFLSRFGTGPDSPVCFRFDKFNSDLSDGDYIDPNLPPPGYSPALALERWSQFVNCLPAQDADGVSVVFTTNAIDSMYGFRLLGAAVPHLPAGADESTKANVIGSFSQLKAMALRRWEQVQLESSTGLMLDFKPSPPSPLDWYDERNADIWTAQSFNISEPPAAPPPSDPRTHLWRLKIDDLRMKAVVEQPEPIPSPERLVFKRAFEVADLRRSSAMDLAGAGNLRARAMDGPAVNRMDAARGLPGNAAVSGLTPRREVIGAPVVRNEVAVGVTAADQKTFRIQENLQQQVRELAPPQRLLLKKYLAEKAPTKPTTTPAVSISFEYCLIRISRPWLVDAFINDASWCVPSIRKGQLTVADPFGATIPLLPIAVVAVRHLKISGNWTTEDVSAAATATDFGPFKVDSAMVNNTLSHSGIQAIGWLLQRMPPLPPNDPSA